ncbi:uncharacterized protein MELLADRAFT_86835 [Melampsora larici-populina 98AG31]|uniref:Uncharacterized protein n=1 Tax=Melampsora larici-populina (strain 98AG31 / pathotype 3-4-7) TaxID=747676 RepID=F4R3K2_MELLP|nr:uncharacterized protein MELLADRAFT_86835 [Melampsora larici-populina 98AG31]EGG13153.1 hypothetical protein MELLADRAFT_86835 [Melampsora larici-populina 98AG31]
MLTYSDLDALSLKRTAKVRSNYSRYYCWLVSLGLTARRLLPPLNKHYSVSTASSISGSCASSHDSSSKSSREVMSTNSISTSSLRLNLPSTSSHSPVSDFDEALCLSADEDEEAHKARVENLLWEAQMSFVNHKLQLAVDRFTVAAKLGSSAACLNLASIYLAELVSQAAPASPKSPTLSSPTNSFFNPISNNGVQETILADQLQRIDTGARWLITGLQYQLEPVPSRRRSYYSERLHLSPSQPPPNSCSSSNSATIKLDLNLSLDLVSLLVSLYCHGKLKPPLEAVSGSRVGQSTLWEDGAAIALRLLNHSSFYPTFIGTEQSSTSPPTSPSSASRSASPNRPRSQTLPSISQPQPRSLSQDTKLTRTIVILLSYLLALARWPFENPHPSLSPILIDSTSNFSHWGQAQARQLWFVIIRVSELPGGVGTKAADAFVQKAYERLNALERPRAPPETVLPTRPSYRHSRNHSMLPVMPTSVPPAVDSDWAKPMVSKPTNFRRSSTSPALCLPRLTTGLARPSSVISLPAQPLASTTKVTAPSFFLGRRHGQSRSSITTPAVPAITIDFYCASSTSEQPEAPLNSIASSSGGLSIEERLQNVLVADEQSRLSGYFDWGIDEDLEEEEEDEDWEYDEETNPKAKYKNVKGRDDDEESSSLAVGMDPVLQALEADSRLNVEAMCAVCGVMGTNCPTCPKCGLVFCSRACRTMASTTGPHATCGQSRRNASVSDLSSISSIGRE